MLNEFPSNFAIENSRRNSNKLLIKVDGLAFHLASIHLHQFDVYIQRKHILAVDFATDPSDFLKFRLKFATEIFVMENHNQYFVLI